MRLSLWQSDRTERMVHSMLVHISMHMKECCQFTPLGLDVKRECIFILASEGDVVKQCLFMEGMRNLKQ
jgi:hypothetical protein